MVLASCTGAMGGSPRRRSGSSPASCDWRRCHATRGAVRCCRPRGLRISRRVRIEHLGPADPLQKFSQNSRSDAMNRCARRRFRTPDSAALFEAGDSGSRRTKLSDGLPVTSDCGRSWARKPSIFNQWPRPRRRSVHVDARADTGELGSHQRAHHPERRPHGRGLGADRNVIAEVREAFVVAHDRRDRAPCVERDPVRRHVAVRARHPEARKRHEHARRIGLLQPFVREAARASAPGRIPSITTSAPLTRSR